MPAIFARDFTIRNYECDAYGHLNNANYVRFMQEVALSASADVGWSTQRYMASGYQWVIRETNVEYLQSVVYGDTVRVTTWVDDFRRVRSRRMYEFTNVRTGDLVARADTDWIYTNMETLRPSRIPDEIVLAYCPEGKPAQGAPREPFPSPPSQASETFHMIKRVEWRDVDLMEHLNNATYFNYIDDCSTQASAYFGWSMDRVQAHGFAIIARKQRIEYLQPLKLDDEVRVSTWVSHVKRATAIRHYAFNRADNMDAVAHAQVLWVWVDLETLRPIHIPQDFLASFADNIVSI
jgi:acyl-CoA thioester hydrolase